MVFVTVVQTDLDSTTYMLLPSRSNHGSAKEAVTFSFCISRYYDTVDVC